VQLFSAGAAPHVADEKESVTMSTVETPARPSTPAGAGTKPITIVDLGKRSKKQIKRLRRGEGRLLGRVEETLDHLKADGEIGATSEVVVVVVKQRDKRRKGLFF
jgi:hypothetical protein